MADDSAVIADLSSVTFDERIISMDSGMQDGDGSSSSSTTSATEYGSTSDRKPAQPPSPSVQVPTNPVEQNESNGKHSAELSELVVTTVLIAMLLIII